MYTFFQKGIFIGICLFIGICGYSQNSYKNKISINYSYRTDKYYAYIYDSTNSYVVGIKSGNDKYNSKCIGYSGTINNLYEVGLNLEFLKSYKYLQLNQKIHILPLLTSKKNRFDLYFPCQLSYYHYPKRQMYLINKQKFTLNEFNLGIGTNFNFSKHFGINLEYLFAISTYQYADYKPYLQFGLSYAWHTKEKQPKTE